MTRRQKLVAAPAASQSEPDPGATSQRDPAAAGRV